MAAAVSGASSKGKKSGAHTMQDLLKQPTIRCFFEVDIDCAAQAHQRARDFVKDKADLYGLSSPDLSNLDESERDRLPELYAADFDWSSKGRIEVRSL